MPAFPTEDFFAGILKLRFDILKNYTAEDRYGLDNHP
jgi:hypothetical protein